MGNKLATFIDTNILLYIFTYQKQDVFQWIDELYDTIYVHKDILEELNSQKSKEIIEEKIKSNSKWVLFDPEDENRLTDDEYTIYLEIYNEIRRQFTEYKELRLHKNTTDYEITAI
ncbi:PIN domain-containing protein [Vagococcus hydrophili]|uniref:PIN domain-containing protein n=1 Tax=Vagococcus hydrophili TaxID=2714947 RepID=A0A6G8AT78_9ENTE|nr:hypothetical protein [Vagococcus hydrophili]QIL48197.1 hypothetical protein G7082_06685 [Vagococcus hydrophili]